MTDVETTICPLCASVQSTAALVCTVCNRDIAIPGSLKAEYEDLLLKREALREKIAKANERIATLRSKGRASP